MCAVIVYNFIWIFSDYMIFLLSKLEGIIGSFTLGPDATLNT